MSSKQLPIIATERVILRPMNQADFRSMRELDTDPDVVRFLGNGRIRTESETSENLAKIMGDYERFGLGLYAATDCTSGRFLGRAGLIPWQLEEGLSWEIGYSFKKSEWNRGLATEVARTLKEWGFLNLRPSHLISLIHPGNEISIRVAKKVGMSFWKVIRLGDLELSAYKIEANASLQAQR